MIFTLLVACLPQNSGLIVETPEPTDTPAPTPPVPSVDPVPTATPPPPTSVLVGEEGGDFVLDGGVQVTVPPSPGAAPVTLSVSVVPDGVPAPYVGLSDHLAFGPTDVTFEPPLTLRIPFSGADVDARVFWLNDDGDFVERTDAVVQDGVATFEVSTLSSGFVAEALPTDVQVPPGGGTFLFEGGIEVDVPPGASADPFTLTVDLDAGGVPAPFVGMSDLIDLGPDDLVLDLPITIRLPFVGDETRARVFWGLPGGGFDARDATIADGYASFEVQVLTTGFVAASVTELDVPVAGGTFVFDGDLTFTVPADAVPAPFTLTVEPDPAGVPAGYTGLSNAVVFGPADQVFEAPVVLEWPFAGPDDDVRLYVPNGDGGWIQLPVEVNNGVATTTLDTLPAGAFLAPNAPVQHVEVLDPATPADVLFVIDDSCSMSEEQAEIADSFPTFLAYLQAANVDFHVGVTTTDVSSQNANRGLLRPASTGGITSAYLDPTTPDPTAAFSQMVIAGTDGWYEEKGRAAAYSTLETNRSVPRNAGFWRDDADLHMVFVSDEEDQSASTITRFDFRDWILNAKAAPYTVESHAIVGIPGSICPAVTDPGSEYIQYTTWTGGIAGDLCEPSWVPFMEALGDRVAGRQATIAVASEIDGTLPVTVTIEDVAGSVATLAATDFVVNSFSVTLDPPAEPGQTVRVSYTPL